MRTVGEVLRRGCLQCAMVLDPEDAVLAVASYALVAAEADEPVRWSRGTIVALCSDCASRVPQNHGHQGTGSYFSGDE